MQEKKPTKNYKDLSDTITPLDYMEWRGCGRATADAVFHAEGFPRIKNTGAKLIADKRAVLLYELKEVLTPEMAKELVKEMI